MTKDDLKKIAEGLLETFISAGNEALNLRKKKLKIIIKKDNTPVTNGDLAVNEKICEKIKQITPNIPIISEETVNINLKNSFKNFWLIDPIDGTSDYMNNKDEFTLNAALIINLEPAIGIIYAPAKDRLFYSYWEGCAFEKSNKKLIKLDNREINKKTDMVAVSNSSKPSKEILDIYKMYNVLKFTNMRSSYKFCVIASGEYDLYASSARACEWDIAAGHAIVIHSGGSVTDHNGNKFKYAKEKYKNTNLLVKRSKKMK
mgnify:CR=1 FL=1